MKKIISGLLIAFFVLFGVFALCACQPGKMADVEGTYELTTFMRKYPDKMSEVAEGEQAPEQTYTEYDYLKDQEIKAYITVKNDGTGYYVYQDKETELFVRRIKIEFSKNGEEISMVKYTTGGLHHKTAVKREEDDIPGYGEEDLFVNSRSKVTLVRDYSPVKFLALDRKYYQYVTYTKVDGATDLTYINKALKKTLAAPAFEMQGLDGDLTNAGFYGDANPYIYYAVRLDASANKADVYYALKADGQDVHRENLAVTYAVDEGENKSLHVTIGDTTYSTYYNPSSLPSGITVDKENESDYEYTLNISSTAIDDFIAQQKQEYATYLAAQEEQAQQNQE